MENTQSRAHDNNNIYIYDIIKTQFFEIKRMILEETLQAFPNIAIGCQVKISAGNLMHIRIGSMWLRDEEDEEEESRCLDNTRRLRCAHPCYVHRVWRYVVNLNSRDWAIYVPALSIRDG